MFTTFTGRQIFEPSTVYPIYNPPHFLHILCNCFKSRKNSISMKLLHHFLPTSNFQPLFKKMTKVRSPKKNTQPSLEALLWWGFSCLAKVGDPVVALWARCLHEVRRSIFYGTGEVDLSIRSERLQIYGTHVEFPFSLHFLAPWMAFFGHFLFHFGCISNAEPKNQQKVGGFSLKELSFEKSDQYIFRLIFVFPFSWFLFESMVQPFLFGHPREQFGLYVFFVLFCRFLSVFSHCQFCCFCIFQ